MLPLQERLRRTSVFQRAYQAKKSISSPLFTLYVLQRTDRRPKSPQSTKPMASQVSSSQAHRFPLVGFVISKKVLKSACQRNRAKRRVSEAYRLFCHGKESEKQGLFSESAASKFLNQWYALVWVLKENAVDANWDEICKKMEQCLSMASEKYGRENP